MLAIVWNCAIVPVICFGVLYVLLMGFLYIFIKMINTRNNKTGGELYKYSEFISGLTKGYWIMVAVMYAVAGVLTLLGVIAVILTI